MTHSKKALAVLCAQSFAQSLVFFAPAALLVRSRNGITQGEFFVLQAILSLGIFALEIPCGFLTDKIGLKKTLLLSAALLCAVRALFAKGGGFSVFLIAAILEAHAACFSSGTQEAYEYEVFGKADYIRHSAKISAAGTAAFIISTAAFAPMNTFFGFDSLLICTLISSILAFLALIFLPERKKRGKNREKSEKITLTEFKRLIFSKKTVALFLLGAFLSLGTFITNFFFIVKIQESALNTNWMSAVIFAYSALLLLEPSILTLLSKIPSQTALALLFGISAALLIALASLHGIFALAPMSLLPLTMSAPAVLLSKMQNELIDSLHLRSRRAAVLSVMNQGANAVDTVFLFASSSLPSSSTALFLCCAAMFGALSIFSFLFLQRIFRSE